MASLTSLAYTLVANSHTSQVTLVMLASSNALFILQQRCVHDHGVTSLFRWQTILSDSSLAQTDYL